MEITVPNTVQISQVEIPPSKSYAQRAILAAALSDKPCRILNHGNSDDVNAMLHAVKLLGATVDSFSDHSIIHGRQTTISQKINCGESGLGTRLLASVVPALGKEFTINGKGSLLKRPMDDLENFLPKFGVRCLSDNGFLPLHLIGNLTGGTVQIDAARSSQYLSGLLMALPLCKEDSVLAISNLTSKPYIDITLDVLKKFGIEIINSNYKNFSIPGNQSYQLQSDDYRIEGDYSAAAFWLVLGAISSNKITITGLRKNSLQADAAILPLLKKVGAHILENDTSLKIKKGELAPFDFDANDCPDLVPALIPLAAACKGISRIAGAKRLQHKESSRAIVLQHEFKKLGLTIEIDDDLLIVYGTGHLKSGIIDSNNDHRIAMSGAISACLTDKQITVHGAQAVSKSYPAFWSNLIIS